MDCQAICGAGLPLVAADEVECICGTVVTYCSTDFFCAKFSKLFFDGEHITGIIWRRNHETN